MNEMIEQIRKQAYEDAMRDRQRLMDSEDNLDEFFRDYSKMKNFDYSVWE